MKLSNFVSLLLALAATALFVVAANDAAAFKVLAPPHEDCSSKATKTAGVGGFSGTTIVQVQQKGPVFVKDLEVGDMVLIDTHNKYQPVYSFGYVRQQLHEDHHLKEEEPDVFQIYYKTNNTTKRAASASAIHYDYQPLEITGNHLIYILSSTQGQEYKAIRVDQLQIGDRLIVPEWPSFAPRKVTHIFQAKGQGLYMPLTPDGTLVAGGVLVSTYASFLQPSQQLQDNALFGGRLTDETLSHLWLSPYRLLCQSVSSNFCHYHHRVVGVSDGVETLPWLQTGLELWSRYHDTVAPEPERGQEQDNVWTRLLGVVGLFVVITVLGIVFVVEMVFGKLLPLVVTAAIIHYYYHYLDHLDEQKHQHQHQHPPATSVNRPT